MGQGGKRSLEGVKERILGQVGGALVSSSDSAVTELRSLGNLLVFFVVVYKTMSFNSKFYNYLYTPLEWPS